MKEYLLKPITETAEQARQAKGQKGKIAKQIVLGINAHLISYQVCRKIDAGGLQPVKSSSLEKLLLFAYKQLELAEKVYAVYEAGPLGYGLYRKLTRVGAKRCSAFTNTSTSYRRAATKQSCRGPWRGFATTIDIAYPSE